MHALPRPPVLFRAFLRGLFVLLILTATVRADDATAILKVRATVEGAEVWLDGALIGRTPLVTYTTPGAHQLRVVTDRYDPFVRRVELAADRTLDINATLTPGAGTVEFGGHGGARVFLDGVDRGPIPIRLGAPTPGPHTWRAEAPNFETATGEFEFVAGRNFLFEVKLASSAGVFVVESTPPGARVRLDGDDVGVTPLRLEGIPLGRHGVELVLEGRATVTRAVDTTAGVRGEVRATLPTTGAALVITTGDDAAAVYLNDAPVGVGQVVRLATVEKGRVRVRVMRGEREASQTVVVPAAGTLSLRVEGETLLERKPLVQRWGFWAAVGGGVAASGTAAAVIAAATAPDPPPTGDVVVTLP